MAGLTVTGFEIPSLQEILDDIEAEEKQQIDANLNVSTDSVVGQINGIVSAKMLEMWELMLEVYGAAYPDTASGQALSSVATITGTVRTPSTPATLPTILVGDVATVVPPGSAVYVEDDTTSRFETQAEFTIPAGGSIAAVLEATVAGTGTQAFGPLPTVVSDMVFAGLSGQDINITSAGGNMPALVAGEVFTVSDHTDAVNNAQFIVVTVTTSLEAYAVTKLGIVAPVNAGSESASLNTAQDELTIATPVTGLDTVFATGDYSPGTDEETDAALRTRRESELARPGTGTVDAIRVDILDNALINAVSCSVFENASGVTDANGVPPYAIEVLVGDDGVSLLDTTVLAQQIWDSKPAGTETYGSANALATDDGGNTHTQYYSEPLEITTYIDVALFEEADGSYIGDTEVANAIVSWADTYAVLGRSIYASDIINIVADLTGVDYVDIAAVFIDDEASPSPNVELIISGRQIAIITSGNINVTST